jgi:hypothetical protein
MGPSLPSPIFIIPPSFTLSLCLLPLLGLSQLHPQPLVFLPTNCLPLGMPLQSLHHHRLPLLEISHID